MVVYVDLIEDLSRSLADFLDALSVKIQEHDPVHKVLVQDARIFSFLRTSDVLKRLIMDIYKENSKEPYRVDLETAIYSLCMDEMLDETMAERLFKLFELADFFALDRAWLDTHEDQRVFEGGLHELKSYCTAMYRLLDQISSEYELRERQEKAYEGH